MISDFKIGKRIECGGHYGTIKFVGPVEGYEGVWLGIDWDDPGRGKHNGSVNNVHYFDARYPTSGSFVRREKVEFGQNLIDSIRYRYGFNEDEQTCKRNEQQLLKFQKDINAPFLQFVGFDKVAKKQRNFNNLEIVNVRLEKVSSLGEPLELYNLCPNLKELDISKNLISSWTDVFEICSQLPRLYWINVSDNILSIPENHKDYNLCNITVLICGNMHLTWSDVIQLSACFPNVEELRVPFNDISDLFTPLDHNFRRLNYLDLEGNNIGNWTNVNKLAVIEPLEHLILENVNLENIFFESHDIPVPEFSNLQILNISDNKISEWKSVGELNKFENLHNLRFIRNPILEQESVSTRQQIIIAKIKNLKTLNGTLILDDERRGAEYDYLKKYALEWLKVQNTLDKNAFLIEHNRYLELINQYGLPEESELKIQSNIIASSLITVRVECNGKIMTKKFPPSILIQKLTTLIQKLFKLEDRPTLKRISGTDMNIVVDLDDEMKELGYYSIQDGDTIHVQTYS